MKLRSELERADNINKADVASTQGILVITVSGNAI